MLNNKTIISIDPGYDRCGVAIVEVLNNKESLVYSTCIVTSKKDSQEIRLAFIYKELEKIIEKHIPTHLAIETLFFSVNKKTAMKVAEARGSILLLAGLYNLTVIELSPQEVKLSVTGAGNTDKKAVEKMVSLALRIDISNKIDDEIDAIALGFAAVGYSRKLF